MRTDILPLSEKELSIIGSGFGSGMGCMKATCGALCGASIAAGMLNNTGRPTSMVTRQILSKFEQLCGATICEDLKGIKTGTVLCSCDNCVKNAVIALETILVI
jgi:C_GCAxxG_C_C family probable redox protein